MKERPEDLSNTATSWKDADRDLWCVETYRQLISAVSFLGSMNKRLTLFYRGQASDLDPLPGLFRDHWLSFPSKQRLPLTSKNRTKYWQELPEIGARVFKICKEEGLPRWRGLRDIREIQWAVIQHYGLWPTPLIDLTTSLRTAASFAMSLTRGTSKSRREGFLYVIGMPYSTGSISYSADENLVLARLQSACPPIAKRPHYQEGFLAGRLPFASPDAATKARSSLSRRLIAKFVLRDLGKFWDSSFPIMEADALFPCDDPLLERFEKEFGVAGKNILEQIALNF